ncbi:pyridine nucleotide-disulfide oxidoreductase domain-containing protein 1 [Platysternon megacephalum]|uniref:Pyridine nucleotide-disulfide oxidoreductase domain-containing protein 1 n=1 Tax=Platysternon megacephalum TaxID=55544 RepID=A0A4D9EHW3_9SAUR|nr:pyridine nucleotide-disulfide oxidoreductase domain-containing protein 1 [Platysternon megacephalum]
MFSLFKKEKSKTSSSAAREPNGFPADSSANSSLLLEFQEPCLPSSEVADEPPTLTKEEPVPLETQVRGRGTKAFPTYVQAQTTTFIPLVR